jgi:hypothetical protein
MDIMVLKVQVSAGNVAAVHKDLIIAFVISYLVIVVVKVDTLVLIVVRFSVNEVGDLMDLAIYSSKLNLDTQYIK